VVRLQIDLVQGMMDCLYAECIPCVTQCVMAELEKLGQQYRVALKVAKVWLLTHNKRPRLQIVFQHVSWKAQATCIAMYSCHMSGGSSAVTV
jgi:rRNA-processing protein FCF1